jgi:hypothetical protein
MEFSTVCEGAPPSTQALFFKRTVAMRASNICRPRAARFSDYPKFRHRPAPKLIHGTFNGSRCDS